MLICDDTPLCNTQTTCSCIHHRDSSPDTSNISNINRLPLHSLIRIQTSIEPKSQLTLPTIQIINSLYRDSTYIPATRCVSEPLILPTALNAEQGLRKESQQLFVIRRKASWENAEILTTSPVREKFSARVAITRIRRNSRDRGCYYARIRKVVRIIVGTAILFKIKLHPCYFRVTLVPLYQ
jgi:hypothetical protein